MNKEKMIKKLIPAVGLALVIGGCQSSFLTNTDDKGTMSTLNVLSNKGEDAAHLAAINEVLDASVDNVPTISHGLCGSIVTTWTFRESKKINGN